MNQGFWKKLKKPIMVLAPMADVTDAAFRRIIAKYGKPPVMWTEFVSADGLFLGGKDALLQDLAFTKAEKPIVAQFFTAKPDMMKKAAQLAVKLGFDGIDINMGCPDRSIEKQGAGAALMKTPALAREVLRAAIEGAGKLPVSVKTRIGYKINELETWLPELLAESPAMITIHARTRKEMSDVPAHWDSVKRAVEIRDSLKSETLIFGNGDVLDIADAKEKAKEAGADGVMLGRAIFGNPWLFDEKKKTVTLKEKLTVMVEHTKLFEKLFKGKKNFAIMKKHYKAYAHGFEGAKELRMRLMEAKDAKEVEKVTKHYLKTGAMLSI
ncbi:MAG: tRNA-dihydrouridine synthase [Patescibacteria group bacterium]|nr:tRNA-dihydrouridine synthase [Patescibacteria group bacterium]